MFKTKLQTLVEAREPFQNLSSKELPLKTSYKLAKVIKQVNEELTLFDEQRLNLCRKYGVLSEKDNAYSVPPDKMPEFGKEYAELLSIEVELDLKKVHLPDTISIKPIDLVALYDFVEIEGD